MSVNQADCANACPSHIPQQSSVSGYRLPYFRNAMILRAQVGQYFDGAGEYSPRLLELQEVVEPLDSVISQLSAISSRCRRAERYLGRRGRSAE